MVLLLLAALNQDSAAQTQSNAEPVVPIGSEYENSIQLLNNRFRIDNDVAEVTMVFFRESGSAPIVLVRPDGSKIFLGQDADDLSVNWYETSSYDMIKLKNPMPGPWQAVGQILPGSKVMVIADIKLDVQPIPQTVYSGEVLKQTATLKNAGKKIDFSPFRDVVTLNIDFVSNNNPNYENFGLGSRQVAVFEDNGTGFDEVAADGIFTGEFKLNIPPGEWRPTFSVVTPMYSREQINDAVILRHNPVTISVEVDETGEGNHVFSIDVDRDEINMRSLLFDGRVKYPNGDVDNISYTYPNEDVKRIEVINNEYGIYKLRIRAYATTLAGRDIVLDVPEFTLRTTAPLPPEPTAEELAAIQAAELAALESEQALLAEPVEEPLSTGALVGIVIGINLLIIALGTGLILVIVDVRNHPDSNILIKLKHKAADALAFARAKLKKSKNNSQDVEQNSKPKKA